MGFNSAFKGLKTFKSINTYEYLSAEFICIETDRSTCQKQWYKSCVYQMYSEFLQTDNCEMLYSCTKNEVPRLCKRIFGEKRNFLHVSP